MSSALSDGKVVDKIKKKKKKKSSHKSSAEFAGKLRAKPGHQSANDAVPDITDVDVPERRPVGSTGYLIAQDATKVSPVQHYVASVLRQRISLLCLRLGWHSAHSSTLSVLADVLMRYIKAISVNMTRNAEQAGRCDVNMVDLDFAFDNCGVDAEGLFDYLVSYNRSNVANKHDPTVVASIQPLPPVVGLDTCHNLHIIDHGPWSATSVTDSIVKKDPDAEDKDVKVDSSELNGVASPPPTVAENEQSTPESTSAPCRVENLTPTTAAAICAASQPSDQLSDEDDFSVSADKAGTADDKHKKIGFPKFRSSLSDTEKGRLADKRHTAIASSISGGESVDSDCSIERPDGDTSGCSDSDRSDSGSDSAELSDHNGRLERRRKKHKKKRNLNLLTEEEEESLRQRRQIRLMERRRLKAIGGALSGEMNSGQIDPVTGLPLAKYQRLPRFESPRAMEERRRLALIEKKRLKLMEMRMRHERMLTGEKVDSDEAAAAGRKRCSSVSNAGEENGDRPKPPRKKARQSDLADDSASAAKRARGRPKKPNGDDESPGDASSPSKRGRGRPPKDPQVKTQEKAERKKQKATPAKTLKSPESEPKKSKKAGKTRGLNPISAEIVPDSPPDPGEVDTAPPTTATDYTTREDQSVNISIKTEIDKPTALDVAELAHRGGISIPHVEDVPVKDGDQGEELEMKIEIDEVPTVPMSDEVPMSAADLDAELEDDLVEVVDDEEDEEEEIVVEDLDDESANVIESTPHVDAQPVDLVHNPLIPQSAKESLLLGSSTSEVPDQAPSVTTGYTSLNPANSEDVEISKSKKKKKKEKKDKRKEDDRCEKESRRKAKRERRERKREKKLQKTMKDVAEVKAEPIDKTATVASPPAVTLSIPAIKIKQIKAPSPTAVVTPTPSSSNQSSKKSKSTKGKTSKKEGKSSSTKLDRGGIIVTQTVGHYVDDDGNQIWICPSCGKQDDGSPMIGCDECDDWYHWMCVGITSEPDEKQNWFCQRCVARRQCGLLH